MPLLLFMLHLDSLDLSGVEVAETKIHQFQGDGSQLLNWEEYGIKIDVAERSLLEAETVEVGVKALVGGEFKFPENTVLVSAVYAVSISKLLLKPLRIKMEHCVDLTGRPDLAKHLKFAIAPTDAPHLPYQFFQLEKGVFDCDSCYGTISRYKFCLLCIVAEVLTGGQEQQNEGSGGQEEVEGRGQEQHGGGRGEGGQEQQGGLGEGGEGSEEVKGGKEQDQPEERKHQPQEVEQKSKEEKNGTKGVEIQQNQVSHNNGDINFT